jgi:large subunit ribosomal protein L15
VEYTEVSLSQLSVFPAGTEITPESLADAAIIRKPNAAVVILGNGEITVPLTVRVQRVTQSAKAKIEAAGGSVETI